MTMNALPDTWDASAIDGVSILPHLGYREGGAGGPLDGPQDTPVHLQPPSIGETTTADPNGTGGAIPYPSDIKNIPIGALPDPSQLAQPSTPTVAPPATPNTGGAGLAGNGPLVDALTGMVGGGGFQSPLDASNSPSTAAIEAITPTATPTTSSSPLPIILIVAVIAIAAFLYFRSRKPAAHA